MNKIEKTLEFIAAFLLISPAIFMIVGAVLLACAMVLRVFTGFDVINESIKPFFQSFRG